MRAPARGPAHENTEAALPWAAHAPPPSFALVYVDAGGAGDEDDGEETGRLAGAQAHTMASGMAACCARAGYTVRSTQGIAPRLHSLLGLRPPRRIVLTQAVVPASLH